MWYKCIAAFDNPLTVDYFRYDGENALDSSIII